MHKYATFLGYSDRCAHEVIKVVSARTIEVRRLEARLLNGPASGEPDALVFRSGGFCGHTSGVQRYEFKQVDGGRVFRIRLHNDGYWYDKYGSKYRLDDKPFEHYDFNF